MKRVILITPSGCWGVASRTYVEWAQGSSTSALESIPSLYAFLRAGAIDLVRATGDRRCSRTLAADKRTAIPHVVLLSTGYRLSACSSSLPSGKTRSCPWVRARRARPHRERMTIPRSAQPRSGQVRGLLQDVLPVWGQFR